MKPLEGEGATFCGGFGGAGIRGERSVARVFLMRLKAFAKAFVKSGSEASSAEFAFNITRAAEVSHGNEGPKVWIGNSPTWMSVALARLRSKWLESRSASAFRLPGCRAFC